MKKIKLMWPGFLICLIFAVPAWFLGKIFPIVGGPVFAILLGILMAAIFPDLNFNKIFKRNFKLRAQTVQVEEGIKFTAKNLLQYSIVLLGFEMNLFKVIEVGVQSLLVMLFTLSSSFIVALALGKTLRVHDKLAILIGVGTSICGGSAIAATSPVIRAEHKDVAQAISTIFLFNIVAVFIFPALGHFLLMSDTGFGVWAGTAINDTSSVVAAATAWSNFAGNDKALGLATIVKLTRTLMIVPITIVLAFYLARKEKKVSGSPKLALFKIFPWFVLGFLAAALVNTLVPFSFYHCLTVLGKFLIVMAMAAVGLNTNLKKLITNGIKPILLGLACWFAVAGVGLLVQKAIGIW